MLGEIKRIKYGLKEVNSFIPYTLNELYITSKKDEKIEALVKDIESLLPLPKPANKFFYDLLLDVELIDNLNGNEHQYTLADLHSPSAFDLFAGELKGYKELFEYAPIHLNKLGYSNRFLKDLHHALFSKYNTYYPGEYRRVVSYVGPSIDDAIYITAEPEYMQHNMDEMELFMHRDDVSVFIRSGLLYYQIMANLPFLVGNEMIGRLVSQLYLREFEIIDHYIPLSRHLEKIEDKRIEAYSKNDINIFIKAYLKSLYKALNDAKRMINGYNRIKKSQKKKVLQSDHTIYQKRRLLEILHQSHKTVYLQSEPLQERFNVLSKTIVKRYRLLHELGIVESKKTYFLTLNYNKAMLRLVS